MTQKKSNLLRRLLISAGIVLLLIGSNLFLQCVVAHQFSDFVPDYPIEDLSPRFYQAALSPSDYAVLFAQTGLAKPAVDDLRDKGDVGYQWLAAVQQSFFAPRDVFCRPLGVVTQEERLAGADGSLAYGATLAPLQNGDILLSLSTHTYGWRHGHAGLVVDADNDVTLEAAVWGADSGTGDANFWRTYSTVLVLRPKVATPELGAAVAAFALETLDGVPYHLTSGVFGDKAPGVDDPIYAQCAYLIWYAYQHFGIDLDSDGGRVVTVDDLMSSDLLEVVQVYGLNPSDYAAPR